MGITIIIKKSQSERTRLKRPENGRMGYIIPTYRGMERHEMEDLEAYAEERTQELAKERGERKRVFERDGDTKAGFVFKEK